MKRSVLEAEQNSKREWLNEELVAQCTRDSEHEYRSRGDLKREMTIIKDWHHKIDPARWNLLFKACRFTSVKLSRVYLGWNKDDQYSTKDINW